MTLGKPVSFVFPRVLMFPDTKSKKTKKRRRILYTESQIPRETVSFIFPRVLMFPETKLIHLQRFLLVSTCDEQWHLCFQNNFANIVPFYEWTRQHSISWNWEPNPSKNKGWVFEGKITCIFRRRKSRKFNCEYNGVRFKLYPCKNDIWAYK